MSEQPPRESSKRRITPTLPPEQFAPHLPPEVGVDEVGALRAFARGEALPHQQKIAFDTIVKKLCGVSRSAYVPGGEEGRRATDYALGKQDVGRAIVSIIQINPNAGGEQG